MLLVVSYMSLVRNGKFDCLIVSGFGSILPWALLALRNAASSIGGMLLRQD